MRAARLLQSREGGASRGTGKRSSSSSSNTAGEQRDGRQGISSKEESKCSHLPCAMTARTIPLLFHVPEDTYLRAFVYAALTTAVTTGIVLEYRLLNPFGTYVGEDSVDVRTQSPRLASVLQTCAVAFVATLLSLVVLHILFAMGDSLLVRDAARLSPLPRSRTQ